MFTRILNAALKGVIKYNSAVNALKLQNNHGFSGSKSLLHQGFKANCNVNKNICSMIFSNRNLLGITHKPSVLHSYVPERTVVKFTMSRGKRQCVKTVLKRFYRLNWGIWIRTKAARHKRRWTKRASNTRRSRQHVFCNASQSWLLDKMVTPFWRKPKYWVDDPYAPYHNREEFRTTRTKPLKHD